MRSRRCFLLGALMVTAQTASGAQPAARPSVAGTWTLNESLSDDARAKMRDAMGGMVPGQDFSAPAGGAGGGGGRGGGRGGGADDFSGLRPGTTPEQRQRQREAMAAVMSPSRKLVIAEQSDTTSLTDDTGGTIALHPDGRKIEAMFDGTKVEQRAEWKGKRLVTEVRVGEGPKVTVIYEPTADGTKLLVTSRLLTPRNTTLSIKRVYDRAAG